MAATIMNQWREVEGEEEEGEEALYRVIFIVVTNQRRKLYHYQFYTVV